MGELFRKDQILTIPNLLSLLRLLLIPGIVMLYRAGNFSAAAAMVVLSGLTDVADGYIARKWRQVSDFGKILDPVADKLTQGALLLCLVSRYEQMLWLLGLFAIKELVMILCGVVVLQRTQGVNSAQWFGKLATAALYGVIFTLFLHPGFPEKAANGMILACAGLITLSCVKYLIFYNRLLSGRERAD